MQPEFLDCQHSKSVFIIIPIHNRKMVTLKCLHQLAKQDDLTRFRVVVVDDGSTDGSAEAIQAQYPQVHILKGSGDLWWTGATKLGMEYAYAKGADYFVWLNDDTVPDPGAIATLVKRCSRKPLCAVSAQCYSDSKYLEHTYGGQRRTGLKHLPVLPPLNEEIACDSLSGNLTCIPRSAVDLIGFPNAEKHPHYQGDTIYTWQLKRAGFELFVTDQARGVCAKNPGDDRWLTSEESVQTLWKKLRSPKSPFYVPAFWQFCTELWGLPGILVFIQPYGRLAIISLLKWIVPKPLLKRLKTARS